MQTPQILGKRKPSDAFPVSPVRRVQTLPDIGSMIHGPHSSFNRPVHASKSAANMCYYHLMSRLQLPELLLHHIALHLELADPN